MAKARAKGTPHLKHKSRKWPRSVDLVPWLKCYLDVCEEHPDVELAGARAATPLEQLAECGDEKEALKRIQRFLDKLPPTECEATGWLALTGAGICLDLPDSRRAEKYIEIIEARHAIAKPRVRTALELNLRNLRALNDLPTPPESSLPDKKDLRQVGKARQAYRTALAAGDQNTAAKALQKMTKLIPDISAFMLIKGLTLSAVKAFQRLGDEAALDKYLAWLDRNDACGDLETGSLWGMGLRDLANKRAENLVVGHLKKLKRDDDSNIHFPVDEICKELWFFLQTGQKETAARLLQRLLRELPSWPGLHGGFASSGVLTELAEVLAEIDGPEAALELLGLSVQSAQTEKHRGLKKGALKAAEKQIQAPGLAIAIAQASSIKNSKKRREELIPLLTRQAAWSELATVLDEITDQDELLESVSAVLFKLPGGARV